MCSHMQPGSQMLQSVTALMCVLRCNPAQLELVKVSSNHISQGAIRGTGAIASSKEFDGLMFPRFQHSGQQLHPIEGFTLMGSARPARYVLIHVHICVIRT